MYKFNLKREKEYLMFWYGEDDNYYRSNIYGYVIKSDKKYKTHFAHRLIEHTKIENDKLFESEEKALKFGVESLRKCLEQYISDINYSRDDYKKTIVKEKDAAKHDKKKT